MIPVTAGPAPDFTAPRLRSVLRRVRTSLGDRADDPLSIMTLSDALTALGDNGVTDQGLCTIPVEQIVGTVGRTGEFDRQFRPLHAQSRDRWQRVAQAAAAGIELPPVDVILLGEMYFVRDGHHRVSVARALGRPTVAARVQRICTIAYAMGCLTLANLPSKAAERLFLERVPLPDDIRTDLWLDEPAQWLRLADAAEAWAFRNVLAGRELRDRGEFAHAWWTEEVVPVIERLREAGEAVELRDVQAYVTALARRDRIGDPR
ncbi:MAG TPA: hypothetical protein VHX59_03165 [Mycobacteriales bacterium]|jgi:hypothetical protein|nr:hypothetical protein [Mycobacteriales bacterium]